MKNIPVAANSGGPEDHTTQPLRSAGQAARLQSAPAAPSDSEPAVGASAVRRTFTSAVTGEKVTAPCMPGCTVDHDGDSNTPEHPHDIYCNIPGTAGELPLYGPLCDTGSPEDFRFLSWQIECLPFSARPAEQLPFVAIEAIDDHLHRGPDPRGRPRRLLRGESGGRAANLGDRPQRDRPHPGLRGCDGPNAGAAATGPREDQGNGRVRTTAKTAVVGGVQFVDSPGRPART
jgi:hypothetical protein